MLRIGEVATQSGVTPDTIRHYERLGVIAKPARTAAGYRLYPENVIQRILLARRASRLGFSLKELARFLAPRRTDRLECEDIRTAALRILTNVDREVAELIEIRRSLHDALVSWDQWASDSARSPIRLLEMLAHQR